MADTSSTNRDELVLDAIRRTGIGIRELFRVALGGIDPNNIFHRLLARGLVQGVRGALPQNRAYYLAAGEKPLGAVALANRLALAWFTLVPSVPRAERIALTREELRRVFTDQTPPGAHVLQNGTGDRPRVLLCYVPDTELVAEGIARVVERAQAFPRIAEAVRSKDYGFAVLVPWSSGLAPKIRSALAGKSVPGLGALASGAPLASSVHMVIERVPSPLTLSQALREGGQT